MFEKQRPFLLITFLLGLGAVQPVWAVYVEGDIASDFTLPLHGTSTDVSLTDYDGHIIVLDFWAHWCTPCKTASAELEPYIQQYYHDLGGNPSGIPVSMISINIESGSPSETEEYIDTYGLETVLDDFSKTIFYSFSEGYVPQIAIINGTPGANYDQWEVLYNDPGYASGMYESFRTIIDAVVVPEPCSLVLLGLGGLLIRKCRTQKPGK